MAAGDKANAALASNITATATGTPYNIGNGKIRPQVNIQATIIGTATVGATAVVMVSVDGTNYSELATRTTALTEATYSWSVFPGDATTHVRVDFTEDTGATSCRMDAQIGWVTTA